jgi:hypothetical protein
METGSDHLVAQFLRGEHAAALSSLAAAGPDLTREAGERIADELRRDAADYWNVCPRERTWVDHQRAVVALAELPGADGPPLAEALVDACCWQRVDGKGSPLEPDVFAWMMRWAPNHVYAAADDERSTGFRFLRAGLWSFPDPDARTWMVEWFRSNPTTARFRYEDMRVGWLRSVWDDEQWNRRVHLLCEAGLPAAPFGVDAALPATTSAAQVRLACTYAVSSTDHLLRSVAGNLRRYRTGQPSLDVGLVWWDAEDSDAELLRVVLEAAGPAGSRAPLVDAAKSTGAVDADRAAFLRAAMPRPAWMDDDVPWEVDQVVDAGFVHLPDGRLSAADPYWAFEGVPFVADVPPGRYPVRLTIAVHPLYGRACALAQLLVGSAPEISEWERLGLRKDGQAFGYRVEVSVGSFGAAGALTDAPFHDLAPRDFLGGRALYAQVDAEDLGSIVMFHVLPQHQLCRTWAGRAADGTIATVVSDLGILHVDPEMTPEDPLRPGSPPAEPSHARVISKPEREAGVTSGKRYRAVGGGTDHTVTVLEVTLPEHSWLRTLSVWYRWDGSRAGDILPVEEFHRQFEQA